jgi:hypothetical protein
MSKQKEILQYKTPQQPQTYTVALRPRPKLLIVMAIVFALWTAFLVYLYFTTIKR